MFAVLQIPRKPIYCQNTLLADSITCKFTHPVLITKYIVQPILKAKILNAHAPCHVTWE